jgi:hypothetical protein
MGRFRKASEGARMKNTEANPPRWAETILQYLLKPSHRDSTVGDLLEEYRVARRPSLGAVRANVWYIVQVLGILWRLIQPAALVLAAQSVFLALTVFRPGHHAPHQSPLGLPAFGSLALSIVWYGSIVGTPGVSIFDAAVYLLISYRGVQRTRRIGTGVVLAAATSGVGLLVLFAAAAIITPGLVVALVEQPLLLLILSVYCAVPLAYSILIGLLAGIVGRWMAPRPDHQTRVLLN